MNKTIRNVLASLILVSSVSLSFISCGSNNSNSNSGNNTTVEQENKNPDRGGGGRKPQVDISGNTQDSSAGQKLYKDGEIVSLADGSKIKYSENGDHELIEKGDGTVIIFKNVTKEDLNNLTDDQRAMVERQMETDPNGFSLIY